MKKSIIYGIIKCSIFLNLKREVLFLAKNENKNSQKAKDNEGIHITPHEHNHSESGSELCILCEKKPAYKTATIDSDLCRECREGFIRTRFRFSGIIAIVLVVIIAVSGLLVTTSQKPVINTALDSCKALQANNSQFAFSALSNTEARMLIGWKAGSVLAEHFSRIDTPQNLQILVEELFYDKVADPSLTWQDIVGKGDINAPWNKELKAKYDYIENIYTIIDKYSGPVSDCSALIQSGKSTSELPYADYIKQYENHLANATTNEEKGILYYCMLNVAYLCEVDVKTQLEYCKMTAKYLPECRWIYLHDIITLSICAGEYDAAASYNATLAQIDTLYAQRYQALMLRYQGKYKEALAILEPIIADVDNNGIYDAFNDAMVCELLSGDLETAYDYLFDLVENQIDPTLENFYLYAMLSKKLGDEETYKMIVEQFEQSDMKLSPTVDKYINGEITIEEIFKNGEAVFE